MCRSSSRAACPRSIFQRFAHCSGLIRSGRCRRIIPAARFRWSTGSTTNADGSELGYARPELCKPNFEEVNCEITGLEEGTLQTHTYRDTILSYSVSFG